LKPLVLCALLSGIASLASAQAPPPKLQVLIVTGQNIPAHDWRVNTPVLRKLLEDSGRFEVRVAEEFRGAGPETLAPYDVVVLNYYENHKPELRWGERTDAALLNYVRGGKGLVIYHFSTAAFEGWTEFEKMCGANWRPNHGHHSARHDFTVDIKDKEHPITRGMKASFPETSDELYANLQWQPEGAYHVLATAWDDHSLYRPNEKQPLAGAGPERAHVVDRQLWQWAGVCHRPGPRPGGHEERRIYRHLHSRHGMGGHRPGHHPLAGRVEIGRVMVKSDVKCPNP
jgi:hypothetical protein